MSYSFLSAIALLLASLGLPSHLSAQTKITKTTMPQTPASKGGIMFETYCATCHGPDGKGDGPAAAAFRKAVPDLTVLSKQNDGEFPAARVLSVLAYLPGQGAHGSSDMPVWGNLFRASGQTDGEVRLRIYNLVHYLEIIQVPAVKKEKPAKVKLIENLTGIPPDSGEAMYYTLCAGCHGALGRGDGPASPLLKGERLDLTTLTKQNGGKFPASRLAYVLGMQAGVAAHGSKEMPVWGESFRGVGEDPQVVRLRLNNLIEYVKGLQRE